MAARAQSVEPSDDGLDRITEKLLEPGGDMKVPLTSTTRWYLVAAAAVVLAGIAGAITLVGNDDDDGTDQIGDESRTTVTLDPTTKPTTTTTSEPPTTTAQDAPSGAPADVVSQAVWPRPSSEVRFDDPVAAVSSWARFYAGYSEPIIGEFQQGDSRSGEVNVQPFAQAEGSTALVRRLSDGHWYVIGSVADDITVTAPVTGDQLTCPQALRGTALAYEGNVLVSIDAYQPDGDRVEVGKGFVTGSGSPPAGPFDGEIACTIPPGVEPYGIVRFFTPGEGDIPDGPIEVVSFPIRLR
jgi:hypothetical protein